MKRHGGKAYLARRIVALMPEHRTYLEPFVGGGSVLLNKPRAEVEIAGDLDAGLIRMWRALATRGASVMADLASVPYTERQFLDARDGAFCLTPAGEACAYIIRSRFSRGGLGKTFAWSDRLRGGQPGDANAWDTFRKVDLPAICERVRSVEFVHGDAIDLIRGRADRRTLIYADPPYLPETRTAKAAYEHEMTAARHSDLLGALLETPARVILSGYRSRMYDAALDGWRRIDIDMPNHSGQGRAKQRRTECLWLNFDAESEDVDR